MRRAESRLAKLLKPSSRVNSGVLSVIVVAVAVTGAYLVSHSFAATKQLYLTPASGTVLQGNTVNVAIHEDSGTVGVNAVQANLTYDPAKFEYESIDASGSAFGLEAQATGGNGSVSIARGITGGNAPATGDQLVATVTFKALATGVTAAIDFGGGSAVVSAADNTNIVQDSAGASFDLSAPSTPTPMPTSTPAGTPTPVPTTPTPTPTPAPQAGPASMSVDPTNGTYTVGSNLVVDIHEDSGTTGVNAVQADYDYPTSQFQFVSVSGTKSDFAVEAQTLGTNGQIRIARGVSGGSAGITGDHIVATVTLKVIGTGTGALTPATSAAVVTADSNTNILSNQTGGSYTLTAGSGGTGSTPLPTPVPTPAPSAPVPVSITGSDDPIPVSDTIELSSPSLSAGDDTTFAVDGKEVSGNTVDTTQLSDGNHTVTATQTGDGGDGGDGAQVKQEIAVHNQPTAPGPFSGVLAAAKPALPFVGLTLLIGLLGWAGFSFIRRSRSL